MRKETISIFAEQSDWYTSPERFPSPGRPGGHEWRNALSLNKEEPKASGNDLITFPASYNNLNINANSDYYPFQLKAVIRPLLSNGRI